MSESILVMEQQACFQLKTSFLPCTTLQLTRYDLDQLAHQLAESIKKAPNFFIGSPIVLDLETVKSLGALDFKRIKQILINNNLVPVGVRGGSEEQRQAAATVGMPTLLLNKTAAPSTETKKAPQAALPTKLITSPIRSGMQIYAKDADLIIMSSVSAGAELLADGHIHVYGPLRGRALAGVQGNTEARIFCRHLEAELVAIAGYYLVKEDIQQASASEEMVQIYLDKEQVKIKAL